MQAPSGTEVVTELAETQESALVSAPKVLVVMCLLVNDWKFQDIIAALQMEENELVNILLRLDRLRIIDYRPPRPVRSP
jgi:transcription initiation factor IIE alpha subunit